MHVAIVGAGALGCVYGARLARLGGCEMSVVGRAPGPPAQARLERVEDGGVLAWSMPAKVDRVPADADVALVCVRYEQLDAVAPRAEGSRAPLVVMTPMMPQDHARLSAALPGRVLAAMPGVVAYANEAGAIRYWLPRVAKTLVEGATPPGAETELVRRLERADVPAKVASDVLGRNVATTVSFIPIAMALDVAGTVDALLADDALLALAFDAAEEGRVLGHAVGKAEAWASMLLRFVGPHTLRMGVGLARSRAAEAVSYVEGHFGRKLHAQNVAMAERIVELATERGVGHEALRRLLERLRASGS